MKPCMTIRKLSLRNYLAYFLLTLAVLAAALLLVRSALPALLSFLPPLAFDANKVLLEIETGIYQGTEHAKENEALYRQLEKQPHDIQLLQQTLYEAKLLYGHHFYFAVHPSSVYETAVERTSEISLHAGAMTGIPVFGGATGKYILAVSEGVLIFAYVPLDFYANSQELRGVFVPMAYQALRMSGVHTYAEQNGMPVFPYMLDTVNRFTMERVMQSLIALLLLCLALYLLCRCIRMVIQTEERPLYAEEEDAAGQRRKGDAFFLFEKRKKQRKPFEPRN